MQTAAVNGQLSASPHEPVTAYDRKALDTPVFAMSVGHKCIGGSYIPFLQFPSLAHQLGRSTPVV